jgi:hypothetical protein
VATAWNAEDVQHAVSGRTEQNFEYSIGYDTSDTARCLTEGTEGTPCSVLRYDGKGEGVQAEKQEVSRRRYYSYLGEDRERTQFAIRVDCSRDIVVPSENCH